jgi:hypothetical protein
MVIQLTVQALNALIELANRAPKSNAEVLFIEMITAASNAQIEQMQQQEEGTE